MVKSTYGAFGDNQLLSRVVDLVRRAGMKILEYHVDGGRATAAITKHDGSPLTLADRASHDLILAELAQWTPEVPILSEEGEIAAYDQRRQWKRYWLVDPLDGTKEFISGNGEFTVNVALIEEGSPVLGAICAPARNLTYAAADGIGSWRLDNSSDATRIFHDQAEPGAPLRIVESRSHASPELDALLENVQVRERVRLGSSLKFCLVAEGRADIYPRLGPTMEWDVAAGDCIYRNSARQGQHRSPLTYNKLDLRNGPFILGASASRLSLPVPR